MPVKTLYVGIDVSKHHLDIAVTIDGKTIEANIKTTNNQTGFKDSVSWITKYAQMYTCEIIHCCIESTGVYSDGIADYLQRTEAYQVSLINPIQAKAYSRTVMLRTKTDKVDAGLLAQYVAIVKPAVTLPIPDEIKELRALIRHLDYLNTRRAQEKGHLESATDKVVINSIQDVIKHYDKQIAKLEKLIKDYLSNRPDLKSKVELLKTIPGIGEVTARILLCEIHVERNTEKITAKVQVAHAGLAPAQKQSGKSVRGKSIICKTGNVRLRRCLYFPAIVASKANPIIAVFYQRLLARGKHKKVAIIAAMRKLLSIAIGVLNNHVAFDPNWAEKSIRIMKYA
jgi:transposase